MSAGANVKVSANSSTYQQALKAARDSTKELASQFSLASTQAKLFGSTTDQLKAKQQELTAKIKAQKEITTWSAEGKDARVEFQKTLDEIAACPDIASATTKAIEVFGTKAGPDLADAIQGGRFEYSQFLDLIESSAGTVETTYNGVADNTPHCQMAY